MEKFKDDIIKSIDVINNGGIILYPTDTIWGIGCDATNAVAINNIYHLKKRGEKKSMIILVADVDQIELFVSKPSKKLLDFLETAEKPVTAIFDNGINLPSLLINEDGTVAVRIVKDDFCKQLIRKSGVPLVSTSANISGENYPRNYEEISDEIKKGVDYTVQHRRNDLNVYHPSSIIKLNTKGGIETIR
ncbi:MAG: L-threonylcarbamoyladenylate synthase [Ginsengibacter sp.]